MPTDESFKNALEKILDQKFAEQDKRFAKQDDKLEELTRKVTKLDETLDERMIRLFNQGFEEVIAPVMEDTEKELGIRFDIIEAKMDSMERKLDHFADQVTDHNQTLKRHDSRISKLKQKIAA